MSTTQTALIAHLVMPGGHPGDDFLTQVCQELHDYFGIRLIRELTWKPYKSRVKP